MTVVRARRSLVALGLAAALATPPALAVDFFGYLYARQEDSTRYAPVDVNLMEVHHLDVDAIRRNGEAGIQAWLNGWYEQWFAPPRGCAALPDTAGFDAWVADLKARKLVGYVGVVYLDEPAWRIHLQKDAQQRPWCPDPADPRVPSYAAANRYVELVIAHVKKAFLPFKPPVGLIEAEPVLVDPAYKTFPAGADWVGFDWYPNAPGFQARYRADLKLLLDKMAAPSQRIIFVPQAEFDLRATSEAEIGEITDEFLRLLEPGQVPDISRRVVAVVPFFGGTGASYVDRGVTWTSAMTYASVRQRYERFAHERVAQVSTRHRAAQRAASDAAR